MERLASLSCFFPAFNEEANLPRLLDEVVETLPRFAEQWEAVVVDDGSTDRSAEIVGEYSVKHPQIRLVRHEANRGYGEALRTGLQSCTGDAIFFTDADLQFRLGDLERVIPALAEADLVIGFRIKRRDPWHRLVVAAVYHFVLRIVFRLGVHDVDCAFKLFRRPVVDALVGDLRSRSAFISPELVIRSRLAGFRLVEIGIPHHPRVAGTPGGASPTVILRTIREIWALRSDLRSR